ncbi:MAG: site-2 protease family protein [Clostridia bacterium]|nr:site-2 protease family protein [Clostridia bacterium]MBR4799783.1 site-2 protease family protein [Clostridia bacterium]
MSIVLTILATVLLFGLLISIHELGHYLVARAFRVGIIEFSIGMGPKLFTHKGKYNDFCIRALPVGGFVNMVGEYDEEIPEEHRYKIKLNDKPVWQRILIVIAGPLMNFVLAYVVMAVIVVSGRSMGTTVIAEFSETAVSRQWLQEGDEIVEINGKTIHCYTEMAYKIVSDGIEPLDIAVMRGGERVELKGVSFGTSDEKGVRMGAQDFYVYAKEYTFGNVVYESFWQANSTVYITVDSIIDMFKGRYGVEAVGGPIAVGGSVDDIISQSRSFAEGLGNLGTLLVFISVSLGVVNLLPIPVLDGGRLLFYIIEAIRRKPMDPKVEQKISAAFALLLIGFMIFIALKDIVGLFG